MTTTPADSAKPDTPTTPDNSTLSADAVQTSPPVASPEEAGVVQSADDVTAEGADEDPDSTAASETGAARPETEAEPAPEPEPYDIERCTLTFRVEIFPREPDAASRLALLAVNSHGDEPCQPRLVAFDANFASLVPHLNQLYAALSAAMPERAAAAAQRKAEAQAKQEAEEVQRKARTAKAQRKSPDGKTKRKRGHRIELSAAPGDEPGASRPSGAPVPAQPTSGAQTLTKTPPASVEPDPKPDIEQIGLFE